MHISLIFINERMILMEKIKYFYVVTLTDNKMKIQHNKCGKYYLTINFSDKKAIYYKNSEQEKKEWSEVKELADTLHKLDIQNEIIIHGEDEYDIPQVISQTIDTLCYEPKRNAAVVEVRELRSGNPQCVDMSEYFGE